MHYLAGYGEERYIPADSAVILDKQVMFWQPVHPKPKDVDLVLVRTWLEGLSTEEDICKQR